MRDLRIASAKWSAISSRFTGAGDAPMIAVSFKHYSVLGSNRVEHGDLLLAPLSLGVHVELR